ncbi:MAG: DUF1636 family protein [Sphingomonadaceae bacterium]|nr:DUF1636 family protein [Sphingomonadaceae bacterium]
MTVEILLCRTCPRDGQGEVGLFSEALQRALRRMASLEIRPVHVQCLGSCRQPYTVSLDAPDKWRIRFSGLGGRDVERLIEVAQHYAATPDGLLTDRQLPPELAARITARSPKFTTTRAA